MRVWIFSPPVELHHFAACFILLHHNNTLRLWWFAFFAQLVFLRAKTGRNQAFYGKIAIGMVFAALIRLVPYLYLLKKENKTNYSLLSLVRWHINILHYMMIWRIAKRP